MIYIQETKKDSQNTQRCDYTLLLRQIRSPPRHLCSFEVLLPKNICYVILCCKCQAFPFQSSYMKDNATNFLKIHWTRYNKSVKQYETTPSKIAAHQDIIRGAILLLHAYSVQKLKEQGCKILLHQLRTNEKIFLLILGNENLQNGNQDTILKQSSNHTKHI